MRTLRGRGYRAAAVPVAAALAGALLAALFLAVTPRVARAAGVVNTCNQAGLAAAMAGGGSVTFACTGTITLTSQIVITQNTTIDGGALGLVTISGGSTTRIFTTTSGVTLRLYNITLRRGNGGALGGGALHLAGPAILSNTLLADNEADFSGAIETTQVLTIFKSTFHHNVSGAYGGAIATIADLYIDQSDFHDNGALLGLGGVLVVQGTLWVTSSTFYSNTADTSGGAISNYNEGHISDSLFYNNNAGSEGGAIHNIGDLWVNNTQIYSNTTFGHGGGIVSKLALHVTNSRLFHNGAGVGGGGLMADEALELSHSELYSNTAPAGDGGGLEAYGLITITDTSLHDNLSKNSGGGAYLSAYTDRLITLIDVDIYGNHVTGPSGEGGGIELLNGTYLATLTRVQIHDNHVISSSLVSGGGGLAVIYEGLAVVRDSSIYSNTAPTGSGGGIYMTDSADVTFINSAIYGNAASVEGKGGGIYAVYIQIAGPSDLVLTNTTVSGNFAYIGGGIYVADNNSPAMLDYATIYGNLGSYHFNLSGPVVVHGTVIGGGISACDPDVSAVCGVSVAGGFNENCSNQTLTAGFNIDDDGSCDLNGAGDVSDGVFTVAPLAWNGGPTLTLRPLPGNALIDLGDPANCPPTDQRGAIRPVDGDGVGGARCDKGAYELLAVVAKYFLPIATR